MIIFIAKRLGKKVDLPEGGWFNTEADLLKFINDNHLLSENFKIIYREPKEIAIGPSYCYPHQEDINHYAGWGHTGNTGTRAVSVKTIFIRTIFKSC